MKRLYALAAPTLFASPLLAAGCDPAAVNPTP